MVHLLKAYEAYKESDTFGIKKIPVHWDVKRGYSLFDENKKRNSNGVAYTQLQFKYGEIVPKPIQDQQSNSDIYKKYTIITSGVIMINGLNLNYDFVSQRVAVSKMEGIITSAYISLNCRNSNDIAYLCYLLKGLDGIKLFHGLGNGLRQTLTVNELLKLQLPVPPHKEQVKIVHYLDWKISEMNRFINLKKKEIKLLQELKYSQINQVITKGISKDEMIESNVDWMGEIPSSWNVHCIKQHFRIEKRIASEEGYDVFSITQQGIKVKDISKNEGQMAQSYANYQFVYPGEFAMNHMDLITGYVDIASSFGVTSPDYRVFILTDTANCYAKYYLRVFQIGYKRRIFYKYGKGAANQGRWRLPKDAFYTYKIPVPSYKEQIMIADECDKIEKDIDFMIKELEREIVVVEELRIKTIADVVTGKVDVRDVVVPDYIVEEEILEECDRMEND